MQKQYGGLTTAEVAESRRKHGANILTPPKRESVWMRFLRKFTDPLIIILLIAGVLSVGISFYEYFALHEGLKVFFEPVGIFIAILLATSLAFIFEYKADKEFALLNQVNDEEPVVVMRDGQWHRIPKCDIVVGDIVKVETGAEIPADGTILESRSLMVDESTLTGEPVAEKMVESRGSRVESNTYPSWMLLRGTKVVEGYGVMHVDKVGDATENGKVFTAAQIDDSVKTPLNEQLERLGNLISQSSYAIAALVVVGRIANELITEPFELVSFIAYVLQTIMIAVTLIVVAVPEGLPMAVTLSLAYSMRRMLKTNNLVRKMHACETMGAATVICTDKTGTLTQNRMTVAEMMVIESREPRDESLRLLYENIAVNSTAELSDDEALGNPTEVALLRWLHAQGCEYKELRRHATIIEQVPFSTERKYMSTTVESVETGVDSPLTLDSRPSTFIKGAPEIVLAKCKLTDEQRSEVEARLADYQARAMRTLAFAVMNDTGTGQETSFMLQALVAISDPVRQDVPAAVSECLQAGIRVIIVTGDTMGTAMEIGRQIGLLPNNVDQHHSTLDSRLIINGPELEQFSDEELRERAGDIIIVARARPMDKKRLVEALQASGEVVAVTGDGTNDAPALKIAHVGLSMGDGTAVAKEASDITIINNSFTSIGRAVMWGRSLYRNIQRFILFQMTVNVVACLTVLLGAFLDTQSPLSVTQMLWVNLIMDTFAAMALASLPPTEQVMKEHPRDRRRFIITRPMWQFIWGVGVAMTAVLCILYLLFERSDGLSLHELSLFFTSFVMMQFWNLFNAKAFLTGRGAFCQIRESRGFLFIVALIFVGQILIVQFGSEMFNVEPLSLLEWMLIVLTTSVVFLIGELWHIISRIFSFRNTQTTPNIKK